MMISIIYSSVSNNSLTSGAHWSAKIKWHEAGWHVYCSLVNWEALGLGCYVLGHLCGINVGVAVIKVGVVAEKAEQLR